MLDIITCVFRFVVDFCVEVLVTGNDDTYNLKVDFCRFADFNERRTN